MPMNATATGENYFAIRIVVDNRPWCTMHISNWRHKSWRHKPIMITRDHCPNNILFTSNHKLWRFNSTSVHANEACNIIVSLVVSIVVTNVLVKRRILCIFCAENIFQGCVWAVKHCVHEVLVKNWNCTKFSQQNKLHICMAATLSKKKSYAKQVRNNFWRCAFHIGTYHFRANFKMNSKSPKYNRIGARWRSVASLSRNNNRNRNWAFLWKICP